MLSNGIGLTGLTLYFLISRENAMYDIGFTFWRSGASQKCGCPSDHRLLAPFGSVKIHGFQIVFQSAKVSNQWIQWQVFNLFGAQSLFMFHIHYWLVVWSMSYDFPFSWECHHPNWLSLHHFSEGWGSTTNQYIWSLNIYIYTRMYVIWPSLDIIYHYRSIIVSGGYPENSFYYYYSLLDNRSLLMSHISILCWTSPFFWGSSVGSVGSARPCTEVKQEMCSVSDAMREYTKERRSGMTDWWWLATYIYIHILFLYVIIYNYIYMWCVLLVILFHKGVVTVQEEVLSDDEKWKCEKCKVPASRGRTRLHSRNATPKPCFFPWVLLNYPPVN